MKSQILKIKEVQFSYLLAVMAIFIFSFQSIAQEKMEPVPKVITPVIGNKPPSDAIILFNGKNFNGWESIRDMDIKWKIKDGVMTVVPHTYDIKTKRSFGDCQLHIEWRSPAEVVGESQNRGNSGIFLQERYEVQVLDSYNNKTYVDGQAGSIYKQYAPLVNACKAPGEWQTYDIIFTAPVFRDNGELETPGYFTVMQNGVLIQNHVKLKGNTVGEAVYKKHGKLPLRLQEHGSQVSYRNIWIREL